MDIVSLFSRLVFFYPIHHIGFVYSQYLSYSTAADSAVVHFDRQFSGFFRIRMPFRVYCVIYAALLTLAALAPRCVVLCLHLVLYLPAFWTFFPCLCCSLSHSSLLYHNIFILDTPVLMWSARKCQGSNEEKSKIVFCVLFTIEVPPSQLLLGKIHQRRPVFLP